MCVCQLQKLRTADLISMINDHDLTRMVIMNLIMKIVQIIVTVEADGC